VVEGENMTIDLTGVAEQVKGFYNSGETAGLSAAQVAFKCVTSGLDLPINDGTFRSLKIILPPGRVVSAQHPAPMRWWMTYPMTIVDTIFKALAPAVPGRVIAGHHADLLVAAIHGRHSRSKNLYLYIGGMIGGGWGAKQTEDGMSATICINDGDTHNGPSEQVEAKYPLLVERYALREDSGGAGKHRGGLGTEQVVLALDDIMLNAQIERVDCRPWGLFGGLSGLGNEVMLTRDGEDIRFPSGKVLAQALKKGHAYTLRSGGGGGFGNPLDRKLDDVERDVKEGYVTLEAARANYGVVIDTKTGQADRVSTQSLRADMRRKGLPKDRPFTSEDPTIRGTTLADYFGQPELRDQGLVRAAVGAGFSWRCC
jgi:N-methylhydantoinase B